MESDKIKNRARNNAYSLLRSRPRSEFEIRSRLKLKAYSDSVIEACVSDLKQVGDIDDEKFARFWVESRMHLNPVGDIVLRGELKQKGVKDSIIEAILDEKAKTYNEYELAFNMAKEKFVRLKKLDRAKSLKRLYDFLTRRGFKYDLVRKIIEEMAGKPGAAEEI